MSAGFRAFLLILFAFGAVWAYQFRSTDLLAWLYPSLRGPAEARLDPLGGSPVDELPGIDGSQYVDVSFEGWTAPRPHAYPPRADRWRSPWGAYAGDVTPEPESLEDWTPDEEWTAEQGRPWADPPPDDAFDVEDAGLDSTAYREETTEGAVEDGADPRGADSADADAADAVPPPPLVPSPPVAYEELTYSFEEGDSLWKVAEKLLGSGARVPELLELNRDALRGVDPSRIAIGTKLRVRRPIREESLKNPPPQVDRTVEAESGPSGPTLHDVKRNESLEKIARKYYPGDPEGWRRLYEANREQLPSPDCIRQGQILKVPAAPRR